MENRSNALADGLSTPTPTPQFRKPRLGPSAPRRELQVGVMPRTNVLVVGSSEATRIVLDMLRLDLRGPVLKWRPGQPLELPTRGRAATMVLEDLTRLTDDEQVRILRWLDEVVGQIRVVSTTTVPIWPRVARGEFNDVLYYRLNTVYVDVGS
jgi:Sigma-54 interaction domain